MRLRPGGLPPESRCARPGKYDTVRARGAHLPLAIYGDTERARGPLQMDLLVLGSCERRARPPYRGGRRRDDGSRERVGRCFIFGMTRDKRRLFPRRALPAPPAIVFGPALSIIPANVSLRLVSSPLTLFSRFLSFSEARSAGGHFVLLFART